MLHVIQFVISQVIYSIKLATFLKVSDTASPWIFKGVWKSRACWVAWARADRFNLLPSREWPRALLWACSGPPLVFLSFSLHFNKCDKSRHISEHKGGVTELPHWPNNTSLCWLSKGLEPPYRWSPHILKIQYNLIYVLIECRRSIIPGSICLHSNLS